MKYFTIEEMEHSAIADAKGIINKIPPKFINYVELMKVLDPIRSQYTNPIYVKWRLSMQGVKRSCWR